MKKRIALTVEVNLDQVPGWGHKPEDFETYIQSLLNSYIGHYKPTVMLAAGFEVQEDE